ncbi:MAG: hypothetical protein NZ853_05330 [Leptospiraceae bacterium]|nr:hypothetical protein [Leptospiraceae bacterium]MDW7976630.1 hypothetical protein [Leptospiraceae bacterium]
MELNPHLKDFATITVVFGVIWGVFSILHLFHKAYSFFWRISIVVLFLLFVVLNFSLFHSTFLYWKSFSLSHLNDFFKELNRLFEILEVFIYFSWPFILMYSFFSAKEDIYVNRIKMFIVVTLFVWLIHFVSKNTFIQNFYQNLIEKKENIQP